MKFEQVLQIYWTKGFLCSGRVLPFNVDWRQFSNATEGIALFNKLKLLRRFELSSLYHDHKLTFDNMDKESRRSMNRIFSQMSSINYRLSDLTRLNIIRLYLIKSFRGKAQACGKPSRGQRTWSNAWTSFTYNKELRVFIAQVQNQINKNKREEKINYKLIKKKTLQSTNEPSQKKLNIIQSSWF
jgi:ribosomal protein S13